MRVLVIDNYDSFVYNIAQYLGELGAACDVARNDAVTVGAARAGGYGAVVLSPGPGRPGSRRDFGVCADVIREMGPSTPVLGVCLGHQGIVEAYGGRVGPAGEPRHGKASPVRHRGGPLFEGVPSPFMAARYHSLVGERAGMPAELEVDAVAEDDGEVMAVRHRRHPVAGVQFHPESIATEHGRAILGNFLRMAGGPARG